MSHDAAMPKHPKRPRDPAQLAKAVIDIATGEKADVALRADSDDNPATEFAKAWPALKVWRCTGRTALSRAAERYC